MGYDCLQGVKGNATDARKKEPSVDEGIQITPGSIIFRAYGGKTVKWRRENVNLNVSLSCLKGRCRKNGITLDAISALNRTIDTEMKVPNYDEIKCEVKRIVETITKRMGVTNSIATGSSSAGIRIGLPIEADFLVETPEGVENLDQFHKRVQRAVAPVIRGKKSWRLLKTTKHGAGSCVILLYNDTTGVSFDLIPAVTGITKRGITRKEADRILSQYVDENIESSFTKLLKPNPDCEFDTGVLENKLLKNLNESKKSGFRVAKYLVQNDIYDGSRFQDEFEDKKLDHFGYETMLKSFYLRVIFLHLLIDTFGSPNFEKLGGGTLTLCLLDLLQQFSNMLIETRSKDHIIVKFEQPLVNYDRAPFKLVLSPAQVKIFHERTHFVIDTYLRCAKTNSFHRYRYLNYPNEHTSSTLTIAGRYSRY